MLKCSSLSRWKHVLRVELRDKRILPRNCTCLFTAPPPPLLLCLILAITIGNNSLEHMAFQALVDGQPAHMAAATSECGSSSESDSSSGESGLCLEVALKIMMLQVAIHLE